MFDCHVHSRFSSDSDLDAAEGCRAAIDLGLQGIAFTDHLDYDYPGYENEFMIDFSIYDMELARLKQQYDGRLKVLKGVEAGIQPHVLTKTEAVLREHRFDYILASVHIIDGLDPYTGGFYTGKSRQQAYSRYLEEIRFMIGALSDFDAVGHFDYVIRCARYDDRTLRYCDHSELFDYILKTLALKGKGVEVNTRSYIPRCDGTLEPEYDTAILKRFRELGGEMVCLGSDSHSQEFIGYRFEYFSEIIKAAGFKYTCYFEDRKPRFVTL